MECFPAIIEDSDKIKDCALNIEQVKSVRSSPWLWKSLPGLTHPRNLPLLLMWGLWSFHHLWVWNQWNHSKWKGRQPL